MGMNNVHKQTQAYNDVTEYDKQVFFCFVSTQA